MHGGAHGHANHILDFLHPNPASKVASVVERGSRTDLQRAVVVRGEARRVFVHAVVPQGVLAAHEYCPLKLKGTLFVDIALAK